jgi:hypothetical protein
MSDLTRFEFALQEPALSIAKVFVALPKKMKRDKLDVAFTFGDTELQWRGPDALGATDQSVLFGLLSISAQQKFRLSPSQPKDAGRALLSGLDLARGIPDRDFSALTASWRKIVVASGYRFKGSNYIELVRAAVKRLSETTVWEKRNGKEYQSRLLSWIEGDMDGVIVVLNRRATDALCGGQHTRISLTERHMLDDAWAKILHAWLSGCMHVGAKKKFSVIGLQSHVWAGEATGSALRSRLVKLRNALADIGQLPSWECELLSRDLVEVRRTRPGSIGDKRGQYRCARAVSTTAENREMS